MENKKILIMMSTYNGEKYLYNQVNSIINQRCNYPIDILIRDDGSTDHTIELLKNLENTYQNIKVIYGNNKGVNESFLELIKKCSDYDYYGFSDQDDIWKKEKIQVAINNIEKEELINDEPILYGSCSYITDEQLNVIGKTNTQQRKITFYNTIIQNIFPGHSQVMNKKLIEILKKTVEIKNIYLYDSWILNVSIIFGRVIFDNEAHTYYRQHDQNVILMDSIKTAYSTAYSRLLLLAKSGKIGKIVSVDATATSLRDLKYIYKNKINNIWSSIDEWGPIVMLPAFQLLGTNYQKKQIISKLVNDKFDIFTKIDFIYNDAVATVKVGKGVKSEGELIISGTKGYIYVPAPWWKTEYFEIRYENQEENKRYFYQLEGEGIRYELVSFLKSIKNKKNYDYIDKQVSVAICKVIEDFHNRKYFTKID